MTETAPSRVAEIAEGLSPMGQIILSRTPSMIPTEAFMIATGGITSGMVAAFARAQPDLFQRIWSKAYVAGQYRLTPLGEQVREYLKGPV